MNDVGTLQSFGELIEPATLRIERLLPAPIERCWDYLTDAQLRRQWLASGDMPTTAGQPFELVWRNDELSDPPAVRPEGFPEEHRMTSEITAMDPPRKLAMAWGSTGGVTFELEARGAETLLKLTHHRVPERGMLLNVSAGWHAHLDILLARLRDDRPQPFWPAWQSLKQEYVRRLPA